MAANTVKVVEKKIDPEKDQEINNTKTETQEVIDYDVLLSSAGEFGLYQFILFLTTLPFYCFGVFAYYSQMFMTETSPNHWCWVPELANLSELERRSLAIPQDENSRFGYSQCYVYDANWTEVLSSGQLPDQSWKTTPCQYGWEFDKSEIPYPTIGSEMGWVCDKNSYQATAQALFFVGSIVGGFLIGWVADRYGRLPAAIWSSLIGCVGGILSTFARNFFEFATCRFITGMAYDNCMMMAYLILLEYISPKYKTLVANSAFAIFYSFFVTLLPWISLACGHWKTISLVTSIPLALAAFAPFYLPESPRWLLSKGRVDETVEKILTIGRINKKEIPPKLIEEFKLSISKKKNEETHSCLEIFKRPPIRRTFILISIEFMCCTLIFDALVRSIGQLEFDFFVSFSVVSFTEFPSLFAVAFIMDWMGRRWMTISCMFFCSVFTLITIFVSNGLPSVACVVIARFFVNMSYSAVMQWTAEVLPTSVRASGVSFVHICGYLATGLSPYVVYLQTYVSWLPLLIIGMISALGGFLAFALPETAKKDMPQNFDDAEELSKHIKMWDMPCLKRKKHVDGHVNDSFEL